MDDVYTIVRLSGANRLRCVFLKAELDARIIDQEQVICGCVGLLDESGALLNLEDVDALVGDGTASLSRTAPYTLACCNTAPPAVAAAVLNRGKGDDESLTIKDPGPCSPA